MAEDPTDSLSDGIELSEDPSDSNLQIEGRGESHSSGSGSSVSNESSLPTFEGTSIDLGLDLLEEPTRVSPRMDSGAPMETRGALPEEVVERSPGGSHAQSDIAGGRRVPSSPVLERDSGPESFAPASERVSRENLRQALDRAWATLRAGRVEEARAYFRRIASQMPECSEAFQGLREVQELEIEALLRECAFSERELSGENTAAAATLNSEQLFVPQVKKEALELHAREVEEWRLEQQRLEALDRVEAWLKPSATETSESEEDPTLELTLLNRMEAEAGTIDSKTRLDLAIALFELGLFQAVDRWLRPLLATEDPLRLDAGALCAEAALVEGRAWDAAQTLEPLIVNPDFDAVAKVPIYYLRASAALKVGREAEALRFFEEVCASDPHYRDASDRVRILRARSRVLEEERLDKLKKGELRTSEEEEL